MQKFGKRPLPGPRHRPGVMNGTEARYANDVLKPMLDRGEIISYTFERMKLKIGENCYYTPDFMLVMPGHFEFHEVKGGLIRDDAMVKFKAAADMFPFFRFVMMQYAKKQWNVIREI